MSASPDLTGTILEGRYRLTGLLGAGGMGQVYVGTDQTLDRRVAVKVLLRKLADDSRFRERFLREAKAASKIQHPNVVQIIDFGETPAGSVFYAMEHLEGRDLAALLRAEGPLPWSRARHILLQIVQALGATHDRNIIHRDIKPANFFVLEARGHLDFIKLLDFGIAKTAADPSKDERSLAASLTGAGEVMGTAKYMAPEQAYGASDDPRVDVYAVGVVAYEILTGTVPFTGGSVFEILKKHVDEPPRPPRELNPAIPAEVEAIVLRALAKDQASRFASMDELEAALTAVRANAGMAPMVEAPSVPPPRDARPRTMVMDQRASDEARRASLGPGALGLGPGVGMPAPMGLEPMTAPRAEVRSDVVTAPKPPDPGRAAARGAAGPSTLVVPMSPRVPSSVTHGEIALEVEPGAPRVAFDAPSSSALGYADSGASSGYGSSPALATAADSLAAGSTSRISTPGDVGAATGPMIGAAGGAETDSHAMMPVAHERAPAKRRSGLGLVLGAAGVVALSVVGVVAWSSSADEPEPVSSAARTEAAEQGSVGRPEADAAPSAAVGDMPGEPPREAVTEPVVLEAPEPEGDPAGAEPELAEAPAPSSPEPSAAPPTETVAKPEPPEPQAPKPKAERPSAETKPKPRKPPTDAQVSARLTRKLKKACGKHGAGAEVSVRLIVTSTGNAHNPTIEPADPELRRCLLGGIRGVSFAEGTTRTVSFSLRL
ncbi:MAG: protein kinase [Nannocystaceae bacterium]